MRISEMSDGDANKRPRKTYPRHEVRRLPARAVYALGAVPEVLDAGWIAHVGFVNGTQPDSIQPFVIPMLYARDGDNILLHGSIASRLQQALAEGVECCLCVTHVDGLV